MATATEMATMTDSSSAGADGLVREKDIAHILSNMQALQKKVEILEECIHRHNIPLPAVVPPEEGGGNANDSGGIWRQDTAGAAPGDESHYYAMDASTAAAAATTTEKYPADSYSMMVLNAPPVAPGSEWPLRNKVFFGIGLYVALMQIVSLLLLTCGALLDDSRTKLGGPTTPVVRAAQILSLSFYVVFPDASLHDFARALRYYPRASLAPAAAKSHPVRAMKVACFLRGVQGLLAVVPAWILIMTSDSVVGVLLSFAAMNVISNFDEAAFAIARTGAMGPVYQHEVERIETTCLPQCFYREIIHLRYWTGVGLLNISTFGAMVLAWAYERVDDDDDY